MSDAPCACECSKCALTIRVLKTNLTRQTNRFEKMNRLMKKICDSNWGRDLAEQIARQALEDLARKIALEALK